MTWILIVMLYGGIESGAAVTHIGFLTEARCEAAATAIKAAAPGWLGPYSRHPVLVTVCVHQ